jgi:transcriptional regulator with XRE-family HTH domain
MMNSTEAIAARNTLGLTQEALAAELGLTESIIVAWEEGRVRIPRRFEDHLRYQAAAKERSDALAASGLPECDIDNAWENEKLPNGHKALNEYLERGSKHRASCSVCTARKKFVEDHFGKMPPPPMSSSMRAFVTVADRIETWPRWAQPAGWVAMWFGGYSLLKIVFRLPRFGRDPQYWLIALGGLLASISIGAIIGVIYGGFRELRESRRVRSAS